MPEGSIRGWPALNVFTWSERQPMVLTNLPSSQWLCTMPTVEFTFSRVYCVLLVRRVATGSRSSALITVNARCSQLPIAEGAVEVGSLYQSRLSGPGFGIWATGVAMPLTGVVEAAPLGPR